MAFYDPAMFEVHVLLVDHDMNSLFETARLLQFNSYRVTPVHDAVVASALLSSQSNAKFNVVMVDVKMSNIQGFKLVHEATSIDLPVIVMSSSASPTLVKCAIEDGAFLFMQKPTAGDELKYLWQHILRETTRKSTLQKGKQSSLSNNYYHMSKGENFELGRTSEMNIPNAYANNLIAQRACDIVTFATDNTINNYSNHHHPYMSMKPKMCTEWTPELHDKFMAIVKQLGDGRCFPKDILELMNVPGLTRMQVASHLQKCRHGWQPTKDRKGRRPKGNQSSNINNRTMKKYGIFPRLVRGCQPMLPPPPQDNNNNNNMQKQQVHDHVVADHHVPTTTTSSCSSVKIDNISMSAAITTTQQTAATAGTWEQDTMSQNELAAPDHLLPFDFAIEDDDTLIPNNFNMNEFDFGQASDDNVGTAASASFWSTWIANYAREL